MFENIRNKVTFLAHGHTDSSKLSILLIKNSEWILHSVTHETELLAWTAISKLKLQVL